MNHNERLTILVTGVGDTVGQALIKAARMSSIPCHVLGTDRNELCVGLQCVDQGFVLPHCSEPDAYLGEMGRICAGAGVQLILPGSEKELVTLAQHAGLLRSQTGAIVVASPPEVLRVGMNKWETCRFLEQAGLNFPRFARLDRVAEVELLVEVLGFPLIAKPLHGTGGRGLLKIKSWDDIAWARTRGVDMVLQEFLPQEDEEYSVEVYTLKNGRQAGAISYRRGQLSAGDTARAHVAANDVVEAEARAVAAALGAVGPCNIQLRLTEHGPITFEINPRFSGGVSIRAHFGYNEVEMAMCDLVLDKPVPPPIMRTGVALRFWDEMYLNVTPQPARASCAEAASCRAAATSRPRHAAEGMEILRTDDSGKWLAVLEQLFQHDFHHLPQYHRVAEQHGEGVAHLFTYRQGDYLIALPLLLRPVNDAAPGGWHDATSVYGYLGPVASHETLPEPVTRKFQQALLEALTERSVITVFSRMHPLIAQHGLLAGLGECRAIGQTVSIDLTQSAEAQWARYNKSCRKNIKRLRQLGFVGLHDIEKRYLREFVSIYHETMRRVNGHDSYFFDEGYFNQLARELGPTLQLFVALVDGVVAAASLATICDGIVEDFLGGTQNAFLKFSPDRLVVDTERLWAKEQGARVVHLGGGLGALPDSVFRYKAGFSDRRHTFCTWRWVLQPEVYQSFCDERARCNRQQELQCHPQDYFPAYRCPTVPAHHQAPMYR